jgi:pimeloyl-ACP methyl ester carboxylesterase
MLYYIKQVGGTLVLSDFDRDDVRSAILREGLAFLAYGMLMPLGGCARAAPGERRPDQRTLVFVHGLAGSRGGLLPLRASLRVLGHRTQYAFGYSSRGSLEALALRLKRRLDQNVRGGRIALIAHSMGGLVARYYLQRLGGARRVDTLVTLATPHHGSHAATFIPSALVRQLLPDGPFVRQLNALPAPPGVRTTSIVAGRDLLVQPVESARCPFGDVVHFDHLGHLELLFRPEVFAAVAVALSDRDH